MAEAARQIDIPGTFRSLEGERLKGASIHGAALMILEYVQEKVDESSDLGAVYQILQGLQSLLETLPEKMKILDAWQESPAPFEERKYRISERLRSIREELRMEKTILPEKNQGTEESPPVTRNPIIDAFAEEQRQLILKSEELKAQRSAGEDVSEALQNIERQMERNKLLWREEVKKMQQTPSALSAEKRGGLEMRLHEIFEADPEVKKPMTVEEKENAEKRKEQELEAWLQSLHPQAQQLVRDASKSIPQKTKKKKKEPYRFRQQTEAVVQQVEETLQEIKSRNKYFDEKLRERIRGRISRLLQQNKVPLFLKESYSVTAECVEGFAGLEEDHPLFVLGKKIQALHSSLPRIEQIDHSGFSRAQMLGVRQELQVCLSELIDPEEKLKALQDEIARKAMNPQKGPVKASYIKAMEQKNEYRKEIQRKQKKGGWRGRNKW